MAVIGMLRWCVTCAVTAQSVPTVCSNSIVSLLFLGGTCAY